MGALENWLEDAAGRFAGRMGVHAIRLAPGGGEEAAWRADEIFPSASLVKVPLLLALGARVKAGEMEWSHLVVWDPEEVNYPDDDDDGEGEGGLLAKFAPGTRVSVRRLAGLMLAFSDNHASLLLQSLVGGGLAVNALLAELGFTETRVNSRTPGREEFRRIWGWGQTTPREMTRMLTRLRRGEIFDKTMDADLYRLLGRSQLDGEMLSALPPGVLAASKQGAVQASRGEVMLVHAPGGEYALCALTDEQADRRWTPDNEGWRLLRAVSAKFWSEWSAGRTSNVQYSISNEYKPKCG